MKSFIYKLYLIMLISFIELLAQTLNPYKFFPSSVGNVWEYLYSNGIYRFEIVADSLLQDSSKYIYYAPNTDPVYRIDKNYNVYWMPTDSGLNWHYYKLDADSGDHWIVDIHHIVDTFYVYKLAKVDSVFNRYFYDRFTTFKVITYYQYQPDSIINQYSWPTFTITLGYGIGEIMEFDQEGGGPQRILRGCIIDGDTIGIITNVENNYLRANSFELFQNFPNPFNNSTTIKFSLPETQRVKLTIYSLLGEELNVLVNEYKTSGVHSVVFNADNLPSGVYIYRIVAGSWTSSKKLIILK